MCPPPSVLYCGRKVKTSYTLADFFSTSHISLHALAKFLFSARISFIRWHISLSYAAHFSPLLDFSPYINMPVEWKSSSMGGLSFSATVVFLCVGAPSIEHGRPSLHMHGWYVQTRPIGADPFIIQPRAPLW